MESLRIITINTWKCDGAYRSRIEWLAQELRRLQADVVACQEAFRDCDRSLDTADYLATSLGFSSVWTPARLKERTCEGERLLGWSGMALLSKQSWRSVQTLSLPEDDRDGERVAQIGVLDWQRPVIIANLHLTHLRDADELRRAQLDTVLGHPCMQDPEAYRIVCGDFNTTRDGAVLGALLGQQEGLSLRDTLDLAESSAVAGEAPRRQVDYILSLAADDASQPMFSSAGLVLDRPEPETGVYPSDHPGIAVTLLSLAQQRWRRREEKRLE